MGMLPDVMWDLRPVDFWRLYNAHKKRERQKIRMLSLQMISNSSADDAAQAEIDLYQDLWRILTESKIKNEHVAANPLAEMTDEERLALYEADKKMLEEMNKKNNPNG
jgi:hypothetical protein